MAYDWEEGANQEGAPQAEALPEGLHEVTITRVVRGSKAGAFRSRKGDPQIMLIFADSQGREASLMVTLSPGAGWVLAKVLGAAGADLAKMRAAGVEPKHFANEAWGDKQLVGRRLRIQVRWPEGGQYPEVTPVRRGGSAAAAASPAADRAADFPPGDDTIPF